MADESEVLNVLVGLAAAVAYPNGTASPSITGGVIKIYPGWPVPNILETDIKEGGVHVSAFPLATEKKMPTALGRPYRVINPGSPTIAASAAPPDALGISFIVNESVPMAADGYRVTLSGTVTTPQNVYFLVDGTGYHYSVQNGDTLTSIATAMATLIPNANNAGPVITILGAAEVIARVGGVGTAARELRRQAKDFVLTIWAPTPALRDTVSSALDSALSESSNLSLSDGLPAFMVYARSLAPSDASENYLIYRRDIVFTVNYATSQTISAPQVVAPVMTTNDQTKNI